MQVFEIRIFPDKIIIHVLVELYYLLIIITYYSYYLLVITVTNHRQNMI